MGLLESKGKPLLAEPPAEKAWPAPVR